MLLKAAVHMQSVLSAHCCVLLITSRSGVEVTLIGILAGQAAEVAHQKEA